MYYRSALCGTQVQRKKPRTGSEVCAANGRLCELGDWHLVSMKYVSTAAAWLSPFADEDVWVCGGRILLLNIGSITRHFSCFISSSALIQTVHRVSLKSESCFFSRKECPVSGARES